MWLRFAFCVEYHMRSVYILLLFVGFFACNTLLSCLLLKQLSLFCQNILKSFFFSSLISKGV